MICLSIFVEFKKNSVKERRKDELEVQAIPFFASFAGLFGLTSEI
jgi:hypothetical protein